MRSTSSSMNRWTAARQPPRASISWPKAWASNCWSFPCPSPPNSRQRWRVNPNRWMRGLTRRQNKSLRSHRLRGLDFLSEDERGGRGIDVFGAAYANGLARFFGRQVQHVVELRHEIGFGLLTDANAARDAIEHERPSLVIMQTRAADEPERAEHAMHIELGCQFGAQIFRDIRLAREIGNDFADGIEASSRHDMLIVVQLRRARLVIGVVVGMCEQFRREPELNLEAEFHDLAVHDRAAASGREFLEVFGFERRDVALFHPRIEAWIFLSLGHEQRFDVVVVLQRDDSLEQSHRVIGFNGPVPAVAAQHPGCNHIADDRVVEIF